MIGRKQKNDLERFARRERAERICGWKKGKRLNLSGKRDNLQGRVAKKKVSGGGRLNLKKKKELSEGVGGVGGGSGRP